MRLSLGLLLSGLRRFVVADRRNSFLWKILETGLTYCGIYCTIHDVPERNGTIERVGGLKDGRNYKMRKMQRLQVVLSGGIEKQPKRLVYP